MPAVSNLLVDIRHEHGRSVLIPSLSRFCRRFRASVSLTGTMCGVLHT